jgi:ABC-type Fe3+ transport system substrate-binding protein
MGMKEKLLAMTIKEIVDLYPETKDVFVSNGFELFSRQEAVEELGAILRLKTALLAKQLDLDAFAALLEEKIEETVRYNQLLSSVVVNTPGKTFNFVAQLPCALKVPLQRELQFFLQQMGEDKKIPLNYYTGACCNDVLSYSDCIPHLQSTEEAPDLVVTSGFHFFNRNFINRFVKKGEYVGPELGAVNHKLLDMNIFDSDRHYNVIAFGATVMVIDKKRMNGLPVPRTWGDLLKEEYERKVVLNSYGDCFSEVLLLNTYKQFGKEGVAALGHAVHHGAHPAQMVKDIQSNKANLPPIYVMSYFFANTISAQVEAEVVWPEDGALISPFFLMVKKDKIDESRPIIDFMMGPVVGKICADAYFPTVRPDISNRLPDNASFKWLGWDFVKEHDLGRLLEELNEMFLATHRLNVTPKKLQFARKEPTHA